MSQLLETLAGPDRRAECIKNDLLTVSRDPSIPSPADWPRFIANAVTYTNGTAMDDDSVPRVVPYCRELRALASDYAALRASHQRLKEALAAIVEAARHRGNPPSRDAYTTSNLGRPLEQGVAALKDAP